MSLIVLLFGFEFCTTAVVFHGCGCGDVCTVLRAHWLITLLGPQSYYRAVANDWQEITQTIKILPGLCHNMMLLLSTRKSARKRRGTHLTEQYLLKSVTGWMSLTSLTQHRHRSELQTWLLCELATVLCCVLIWFLYLCHMDPPCFLSPDGEAAEGRAADSVRAAGISRKEVQWSWSCVWLPALAWRRHVEVSILRCVYSLWIINHPMSQVPTSLLESILSCFCLKHRLPIIDTVCPSHCLLLCVLKGCSGHFRVWRAVSVHSAGLLQRISWVCHIRKCWDA